MSDSGLLVGVSIVLFTFGHPIGGGIALICAVLAAR